MEMLSTWDLGPGVRGCLEGSAARERGPGRCGQGHRQLSAAGPAEEVQGGGCRVCPLEFPLSPSQP